MRTPARRATGNGVEHMRRQLPLRVRHARAIDLGWTSRNRVIDGDLGQCCQALGFGVRRRFVQQPPFEASVRIASRVWLAHADDKRKAEARHGTPVLSLPEAARCPCAARPADPRRRLFGGAVGGERAGAGLQASQLRVSRTRNCDLLVRRDSALHGPSTMASCRAVTVAKRPGPGGSFRDPWCCARRCRPSAITNSAGWHGVQGGETQLGHWQGSPLSERELNFH